MGQEDWKQTDLIASDGTGSRTLDVGGHVISAVWRPGGRQILFLGLLDGGAHDADVSRGFYIADADGTNVRQLPVGGLEWSPDGKRISFVTEDAHGINQINIADIDEAGTMTGSRRLKLDPESSDEYGPQWSPDGSQLAFELGKGNREYVGVVDSDGSGFRILVPEGSALAGQSFTWSPDGRSLVFVQAPFFDPDGNLDHRGKVWSVDVATGEQTEVQTPVESWQRLAP
jgi:Tol biopolymer transport system component